MTATVGLDLPDDAGGAPDEPAEAATRRDAAGPWSPAEQLRTRDFATCSRAELDEAHRLIADLRLVSAQRSPSPPAHRVARGPPDRAAPSAGRSRADGEPIRRAFTRPSERPRPVVLLCDVRARWSPTPAAFVRFLPTAVVGGARVEAFGALGEAPHEAHPRAVVPRPRRGARRRRPAGHRLVRWHPAGRRPARLQRPVGCPGPRRGATVVILSDGWDRGDPDLLAGEMRRLRRVAHRVVWVNPLKATADYAPLARASPLGAAPRRRVRDRPLGRGARRPSWPCWPADPRAPRRHRQVASGRAAPRSPASSDSTGSGPRDPGAAMAVNDSGEVAGSVLGGVVEGAVVTEALAVLAGDRPHGAWHFRVLRQRHVRGRPHLRRDDPRVRRAPRLVSTPTPVIGPRLADTLPHGQAARPRDRHRRGRRRREAARRARAPTARPARWHHRSQPHRRAGPRAWHARGGRPP